MDALKCEACGGRGFTEKNMGFVQVKCHHCNGTGRLEATDVEFTAESAEPEKAGRGPYTRKSRRPRKPTQSRQD